MRDNGWWVRRRRQFIDAILTEWVEVIDMGWDGWDDMGVNGRELNGASG